MQDDNKNQQGVDKYPDEEQGKGEKVSHTDLKGKKVDRDTTEREDDPVTQKNSDAGNGNPQNGDESGK